MNPTYEWTVTQVLRFSKQHPDLAEWIVERFIAYGASSDHRELISRIVHADDASDGRNLAADGFDCQRGEVFARAVTLMLAEITGEKAAPSGKARDLTPEDFGCFLNDTFYSFAAATLAVEDNEDAVIGALLDVPALHEVASDCDVIRPGQKFSPREIFHRCFIQKAGRARIVPAHESSWSVVLPLMSSAGHARVVARYPEGTVAQALAAMIDEAKHPATPELTEESQLGSGSQRFDAIAVATISSQIGEVAQLYRNAVAQAVRDADASGLADKFPAEVAAVEYFFQHAYRDALTRIFRANAAAIPERLKRFAAITDGKLVVAPELVRLAVLTGVHPPESDFFPKPGEAPVAEKPEWTFPPADEIARQAIASTGAESISWPE